MHKFAKLGLAAAALVVPLTAGCSKGNNAGTGSSSIPLPVSSIPGPTLPGAAAGPTTTARGPKPNRPQSCDTSDLWSYALLEAYNRPAAGSPTDKLAINDRLDKTSKDLKAALPQYSAFIETETTKAKSAMDGKPGDTAPANNEYDTWYKSTCLA